MSRDLQRIASAVFLLLMLPLAGHGYQTGQSRLDLVPGLLLQDDIEGARAILELQPDGPQAIALKGEIAFREGQLEEARTYYTRALALDSDTARAHYGLGRLALGKAKRSEAIESLSRAADLEPDVALYRLALADAWAYEGDVEQQAFHLEAYVALDPTYDLDRLAQVEAVLAVIREFGSAPMGEYELGGGSSSIKVSKGFNLIFADVMISGEGPFEFIVDTGASQTVVADRLLKELGLSPIASTRIYGIGGDGGVQSDIYRIDELRVGDVRVRNLPVGTLTDPLLSELTDGIFSVATFGREVVSIDYLNSKVDLNSPERPDAESVDAWFFSNLILIQLRVNGSYEGLFLLDTGAVTSILSTGMASLLGVTEETGVGINLGLAGVAGLGETALAVPDVTLGTGSSESSFPVMIAVDLGEISRALGVELAGIVGYDFLSQYLVTIDFNKAVVTLAR